MPHEKDKKPLTDEELAARARKIRTLDIERRKASEAVARLDAILRDLRNRPEKLQGDTPNERALDLMGRMSKVNEFLQELIDSGKPVPLEFKRQMQDLMRTAVIKIHRKFGMEPPILEDTSPPRKPRNDPFSYRRRGTR